MKIGRFQQWAALLALLLSGIASAQSAQAQGKQMNYILSSEGVRTFEGLVQQAESVADQSIRRGFAEDASLSSVSVKVMGERDGAIAPVLSVTVTRTDWQNHPTIQAWAHYFRNSTSLLGFNRLQKSQPSGEALNENTGGLSDNDSNY